MTKEEMVETIKLDYEFYKKMEEFYKTINAEKARSYRTKAGAIANLMAELDIRQKGE